MLSNRCGSEHSLSELSEHSLSDPSRLVPFCNTVSDYGRYREQPIVRNAYP